MELNLREQLFFLTQWLKLASEIHDFFSFHCFNLNPQLLFHKWVLEPSNHFKCIDGEHCSSFFSSSLYMKNEIITFGTTIKFYFFVAVKSFMFGLSYGERKMQLRRLKIWDDSLFISLRHPAWVERKKGRKYLLKLCNFAWYISHMNCPLFSLWVQVSVRSSPLDLKRHVKKWLNSTNMTIFWIPQWIRSLVTHSNNPFKLHPWLMDAQNFSPS